MTTEAQLLRILKSSIEEVGKEFSEGSDDCFWWEADLQHRLLSLLWQKCGYEDIEESAVKPREPGTPVNELLQTGRGAVMAKAKMKIGSGEMARFDQKNIMYRRVRWDPELLELGRGWYGPHVMPDKPGHSLKDWALVSASWYVERGFAKGNHSGNFGLYKWDPMTPDELARMNRLAPGQKWEVSDPEQMSRDVKRAAKFFGSCLAGICILDQRWVYSHILDPATLEHAPMEIPEEFKYVVVMAVEMDWAAIKCSPLPLNLAGPAGAYSKMAYVAGMVAHFIRTLGYKAIPSGNDTALSIPLAIDAGLGQLGRNGILITEKFGPRVRLCKVFTNLPLAPDRPIDFGVTEFCSSCERCAENCPAGAISFGEPTIGPINISNNGGALKWYANAEKCLKFAVQNNAGACSNCIRVCPFTKPPTGWLHDTARFLVKNAPWLDPAMVWMDKLLGYGKRITAEEFWAGS